MSGKILIDTNLWVYLYSKNPEEKYQKLRVLIEDRFEEILISTQVLGELYNVLVRKKYCTERESQDIVVEMVTTFEVSEIESAHVLKAIDISRHYKYSYWDSLVVATGLLSDCTALYSEDMQHDQLIEKSLRILNPLSSDFT